MADLMIKDLVEQQNKSKNAYFARQLTNALQAIGIEPSPKVVAKEFNQHFKSNIAKPHTVRKWLLGQAKPRSEMLMLLADWLNVSHNDLISKPAHTASNKVSFEFDFTDQEVISKYLAMTVKEKVTVRLLIDAIASKNR
jgi:transcriptional regulator with XRE-family HTH domain